MFDEDLNLYVYQPNSKAIVTNIRRERIIRHVNSFGFLDTDHKLVKEQGIYRIGFFGDSYVEAIQVLLNDTSLVLYTSMYHGKESILATVLKILYYLYML